MSLAPGANQQDTGDSGAGQSLAFLEDLRQLFTDCDTDSNGTLGQREFRELCAKIGLDEGAADETFQRLDTDKDGGVTFDEFAAGFNQYKQSASPRLRPASCSEWQPASPIKGWGSNLAPSPVALRGKSASPLGLLSLGSTGSSSNLALGGHSTSTGGLTADGSDYAASFDQLAQPGGHHDGGLVVYSSEVGANEFVGEQSAGGSGQFGSLMRSSGSFSQLRTMQDLLECVQKLQSENQILSQIFFKDKREREEYISQLGEEFDQQVREVEARANRRAKEELETEKRRLREMMQAERETLQHHYQTIERLSKLIKSPETRIDDGERIDNVRSKLEDTFLENRQLKRSLLDTKTDVAMIRKEMEKLKSKYEEKLSNAYAKNNETKNECDHIKQQLNLMKDSNKKLQDASDVITTYIAEKVEPVISKTGSEYFEDQNHLRAGASFGLGGSNSQAESRRGSILSEYLVDGTDQAASHSLDVRLGGLSEDAAHEGESPTATSHIRKTKSFRNEASSTGQQACSSLDYGLTKATSGQLSSSNEKHHHYQSNVSVGGQPLKESQSSKNLKATSGLSSSKSSLKSLGRHFFIGSKSPTQDPQQVSDKISSISENQQTPPQDAASQISGEHQDDELLVEEADGVGKFTFNIILVGDSFVGKSSFAARFMEGNFVQGLISNCSIDFKTKTYKVDGINYTINLWDTAGQERFRSITASYFRKADGIILMYDVTDKRSYLNVRNWMSTISDTAAENVAVLLVGNKIDLRKEDNLDQCVPNEEGARLAREYEIVFLETSVKTGTNLVPSMGRLIRLIARNNQPQEEDKDRIRLNDKSKLFNCMPKNC